MPIEPEFAAPERAAKLLDMKPADLRAQIEAGNLPPPKRIGTLERFDMAELRAVIRGQTAGAGVYRW